MALLCIIPEPQAADSTSAKGAPDFELQRQVVAAGGGSIDGGNYHVVGTVGQIDADVLHPASGGTFSVIGGFWAGLIEVAPHEDALFGDGFED